MYDVRRLVLIRDLAEHGTVTAVSELHGISTSAVSQQLRALEQEVGSVLVRKVGRSLRLTPTGEVLVEHARRVLVTLDEAESAVAATRGAAGGDVRVVGFQSAIAALAGPLFTQLRQDHPELRIRLVDGIREPALRAVQLREADLAITYHYSFGNRELPSGIGSEFLFPDPLVLLTPVHLHPAVAAEGTAALADEDWIAVPDGGPSIESLSYLCRRAGFHPRIRHRISNFFAMARLVEAGAGVTILPSLTVTPELEHLVAWTFAEDTRMIEVAYRTGTTAHPSVAATIRALHRVARARRQAPAGFRGPIGRTA
ncbi:LysR substrate-binding domain-containing protein [Pseudonocardia aurantiaca]|uniref:LysR family transcriptional regulator n=1 Tax=Pseudonocardia aurantiaca TaxID=75290 RepID=A0ABW4FT83_9PSEU